MDYSTQKHLQKHSSREKLLGGAKRTIFPKHNSTPIGTITRSIRFQLTGNGVFDLKVITDCSEKRVFGESTKKPPLPPACTKRGGRGQWTNGYFDCSRRQVRSPHCAR